MLRSLHGRLVAVLLTLFLFLGTILVAVTVYSTKRYEEEVVQRLNRSLATNLVGEDVLLVNGEVNEKALQNVFKTLNVINPAIEVYLLDLEGNVVTYSAPPGKVVRDRVAIEPIKEFLASTAKLPILGDDPRGSSQVKVFSVSPIMVEDRYEGYLYIVLASEAYDSVVKRLWGSHILRLSVFMIVGALVVVALVGAVLFTRLTRRLRALARAMDDFRRGDFTRPVTIDEIPERGDEIDRLTETFKGMSDRINQQVRALKQKAHH